MKFKAGDQATFSNIPAKLKIRQNLRREKEGFAG
jgi:hypothetical protein